MKPETIPPRIHVLAKPTGSVCNLNCSYCFYLGKELLYPGSAFRMSDEVLEKYVSQLIDSHHSDKVTVAWQGGEPTLMGVNFYRRAIELQEKYRRPGMAFENTMQTNGTLLNDEWCEFFRENDFLIGISIDGPRQLHDTYRKDKKGRSTFDRVMNGLRLLQKYGVEYNVLVTVNRINANYPLQVYRFLRDEVGASWMQFIPSIERLIDGEVTPYQQGATVSDRTIESKQWGSFLIAIFDEWIGHDVGKIFVQTFEAAVRSWLGMRSTGMCVFDPICGHGLALEHNGDLYSCDHFVEAGYLLGNISQGHMIDLVGSEQQRKFGQDKWEGLPRACRDCKVFFACHGECPKNRFLTTTDGESGLNYLCAGYKAFFQHIDRPLQIISQLMRSGLPAARVMQVLAEEQTKQAEAVPKAGRNESCPCGSGLKFKKCHGRTGST
ncbi:MAG TPA: anaerobic sulfatase maturase [Desulfomonilaceae bacterium]|nr:anaerobic sulfatase maturase [Desulfomonilaceae bacterium]